MSKGHVDAADGAKALVKKMVANQSWGEERKQQKGMHSMKEADMLSVKIDLLMKRLDKCAGEKEAMQSTVQAMDSHMTCEVYGEVGHSENNCLETHEDVAYINNGFRQQVSNNGWKTSPARKEVIRISTQISIQINHP